MNNSLPPAPSLPTVSPALLATLGSLRGGEARLFKQVYLAVWRFLWPVSRFESITLGYNIPVILGQVDPSLSIHQWFMLCKLFTLSRGGMDAINTLNYPFRKVEGHHIARLIEHNMINRTSFDPAAPHLVKPSHINKTYISLTPSGISFYRVVVEKIHKSAHNDTYLLATGRKQKARTV